MSFSWSAWEQHNQKKIATYWRPLESTTVKIRLFKGILYSLIAMNSCKGHWANHSQTKALTETLMNSYCIFLLTAGDGCDLKCTHLSSFLRCHGQDVSYDQALLNVGFLIQPHQHSIGEHHEETQKCHLCGQIKSSDTEQTAGARKCEKNKVEVELRGKPTVWNQNLTTGAV